MPASLFFTAVLEQTRQGNFVVSVADMPQIPRFMSSSLEEACQKLPAHIQLSLGAPYNHYLPEIKTLVKFYSPPMGNA